ncbi:MAG: hypothetical protein AAFY16_10855 [Cyanobacteria bacterium J06642_3]
MATQTQSNPATPQPPANTVEGLITNILTPLSQAVYDTYNSLFTPASSSNQPQSPQGDQ